MNLPEAKTDMQKAAEHLHNQTCSFDHAGYCMWYYEQDWSDYNHKRYLQIAEDTQLILLGQNKK
jgi:hypothetical protein